MEPSTTSTIEGTSTELALYKNKVAIKGITLILTEIIEENASQEKKRLQTEKKKMNRTSIGLVKGIYNYIIQNHQWK